MIHCNVNFQLENTRYLVCSVTGRLGAGCYGRVDRGVWKKGDKEIEVALKRLNKRGAQDKVKFLQEATLMAQFRHPNVINLLGVCSKHEPVRFAKLRLSCRQLASDWLYPPLQIILVVELMHKGCLKNYLHSLRAG